MRLHENKEGDELQRLRARRQGTGRNSTKKDSALISQVFLIIIHHKMPVHKYFGNLPDI